MMTEVHGNMMLAALFFQSTGAMAEDVDPMCLNDDFWAQIGQMIAVGMISAIVGLLPSLVISCLHQRDFIECEGEDDPVWKSTLRKWRMRDRVIWVLCGLFCAFSIFFTLLFLANVTEDDAMSWLVAMVTS